MILIFCVYVLGTPTHTCTWEENIKLYLKEIMYENVDWIHLAQDRNQYQALQNITVKLRVPQNMDNFLTSVATVGFLRRSLL
jgi:hypothetical protein